MADLITIVFIIGVFIFAVGFLVASLFLLLKYLEFRKKHINYVDKNYKDIVTFAKQQCPKSIYNYQLHRATTKEAEGRDLGRIVGHAVLGVEKKKEGEEEDIEGNTGEKNIAKKTRVISLIRHYVVFRPKENEFHLLQPETWTAQYRIAVLKRDEIDGGLNGDVRWLAKAIDFFKFYIYSLSDTEIDRSTLSEKIEFDVKLDVGLRAWEEVGGLVQEAIRTDSPLQKDIKRKSEFAPRGGRP